MRYTLETIKYVFKNILYLLPLALVPATFLAFSLDEGALHTFVETYLSGDPSPSFGSLFYSMTLINFSSGKHILLSIGSVLSVWIFISLIMAWTEKNMRIGKRNFGGVFSRLNDNLLSVVWISSLFMLCYELYAVIVSALVSVCCYYVQVAALKYILSIVIYLLVQGAMLYTFAGFYLWLPCLLMTGFRSFEALKYSYSLAVPVRGKFMFGQLISMLVSETALASVSYFLLYKGLATSLAVVLYAFMILLFSVRMQIGYFDRAQIERADRKSYYFG